MKQAYEGVFILDPDAGPDGVKHETEKITNAIQKAGGAVTASQDWGRKRLAHAARKKRDGLYLRVEFEMDSLGVIRIREAFRLSDRILKFVITRREKPRPVKRRVRVPKRAAAGAGPRA